MRRALQHLNELGELVKPWTNGERHTTRVEVDLQSRTRTYFATAEQPSKEAIGPVVGEILHNMRSALDNLAFSLAVAHTRPLPDDYETGSEFPIFGDRDKSGAVGVGKELFNKVNTNGTPRRGSGLYKIRGWHPRAQACVERLQPYHRADGFDTHPLWVLHELDRINKHRALVATVTGIVETVIEPYSLAENRSGLFVGKLQAGNRPIETDTPYATLTNGILYPIDPSRTVDMKIPISIDVTFAPGTPCVESEPIHKTLMEIYGFIAEAVFVPLRAYL